MTKLRIIVVGAGGIGQRHIELIQSGASCELAAIVDPSPTAALLAANLNVPRFNALADSLASRPDGISGGRQRATPRRPSSRA